MAIHKGDVAIVFKTSNRSNAKTKIKILKNRTPDDVLTRDIPGIPNSAVILDIGFGEIVIEKYKQKYKL